MEKGMFPSDVFPSDLAKIDFPNVDYDRIGQKVSGSEIDVLAWYRSFHWDPPEKGNPATTHAGPGCNEVTCERSSRSTSPGAPTWSMAR